MSHAVVASDKFKGTLTATQVAALLDASGDELAPGGAALATLDRIDVRRLRDLAGAEVIAATDVDNPLLGPRGAAAVYGPQKGASPRDVALLEQGLTRWADVAEESFGLARRDEPGAGAAGGLGFAALGFLRASTQPGIELMLDLLSFAGHLPGARLVITGEGALDEQTLHGKAPAGVARAAAAAGPDLPVVAVAGVCSLSPAQLRAAGIARAYALTDIEPDVTRCREQAAPLLEDLSERVAQDWLVPSRYCSRHRQPQEHRAQPADRGGRDPGRRVDHRQQHAVRLIALAEGALTGFTTRSSIPRTLPRRAICPSTSRAGDRRPGPAVRHVHRGPVQGALARGH